MERTRNADLLYDSARFHASAGARSGICVDRTVLFRSPELTVDVVVHASREPLRYLHGQVIRQAEGSPVRGALVRIEGEETSVTTDEYGQFAVSSLDDREALAFRIAASNHEVLCIIPATDQTAGTLS